MRRRSCKMSTTQEIASVSLLISFSIFHALRTENVLNWAIFALISQHFPTYHIPNAPFTNTCKSQCAQSFSLSPNEGLSDPYCLFFKTSILISPQDRSWHVELMNSQERQEGSAHLDVQSLTNWPKVFLHVRFVSLWENDDEIAIRSADSCR